MVDGSVRLHIIAVGEYDQAREAPQPNLAPAIYKDAARIAKVLEDGIGARLAARVPHPKAAEANRTWLLDRLSEWEGSGSDDARSSVLVWIGHGNSTGSKAWLSASDAGAFEGARSLDVAALAESLQREWTRRERDPSAWTIVILQACKAAAIASKLLGELAEGEIPQRTVLIFAGGESETHLEVVADALERAIASYSDNDVEIHVPDFVDRVASYLQVKRGGNAYPLALANARPIPRERVFPDGITATQDVVDALTEAVAELEEDERSHFLEKARGGEQGELAWFFQGRETEQKSIAKWLRTSQQGVRLVTGTPGSGKSALLGTVLMHSRPRLRGVLQAGEFIDPIPLAALPPDDVFDAVLTLTGQTMPAVLARLEASAGIVTGADGTTYADRVDALTTALRERDEPFTVMLDALDEAEDPLLIAATILRPLARAAGCRMLIGTRTSTNLTLDRPDPGDVNILDALGVDKRFSRIDLATDSDAVREYVLKRLRAAREHDLDEAEIDLIANRLKDDDASFLRARLVVHEILANPGGRQDRPSLLTGTTSELFAMALARLEGQRPAFGALLRSLAFAEGRGLPQADRIWAVAASALSGGVEVTADDIDDVRRAAAPYLMLDGESGHTVFRLAHRSFQELLDPDPSTERSRAARDAISRAMLRLAQERVKADPDVPLHSFLRRHLPAYVAAANLWAELAATPDVLDRLQFRALASHAYRSLFGRADVPREIAAAIAARDAARDDPHARRWQRLIGRSRGSDLERFDEDTGALRLDWIARTNPELLSLLLAHDCTAATTVPTGSATATRAVTALMEGHPVVWDLQTAERIMALTSPWMSVAAADMLAVRAKDGSDLLVVSYRDGGIVFWNLTSTNEIQHVRAAHGSRGKVSLELIYSGDARPLVISRNPFDGVRCWDPATGAEHGSPLLLASAEAHSMRTTVDSRGHVLTLHWPDSSGQGSGAPASIWDHTYRMTVDTPVVVGQTIGTFLTRVRDDVVVVSTGLHGGVVVAETGAPLSDFGGAGETLTACDLVLLDDGSRALAVGYAGGLVRVLWENASGTARDITFDGPDALRRVQLVPYSAGLAVLAEGGRGATGLWDVRTGDRITEFSVDSDDPLDDFFDNARLLEQPGGPLLLVQYGFFAPLTIWRCDTGEVVAQHHVPLLAQLSAVALPNGRTVCVGREGDDARIWDPLASLDVRRLRETGQSVVGQRIAHLGDRPYLLRQFAGATHVWDPMTGNKRGRAPALSTTLDTLLTIDRRVVVVGVDNYGVLGAWDAEGWEHLVERADQALRPAAILFHVALSDEDLVIAIEEGTLVLWYPGSDRGTVEWDTGADSSAISVAAMPDPNGASWLVVTSHGAAVAYSQPAGEQWRVPLADELKVVALARSDGAAVLIALDSAGRHHVVDRATGVVRKGVFDEVADPATSAHVIPSSRGADLMTLHSSHVIVWDLATGEQRSRVDIDRPESATAIQWSDGEVALAFQVRPSETRLWSVGSQTWMGRIDARIWEMVAVMGPGGEHLVAVSVDTGNVLALWHPQLGLLDELRIGFNFGLSTVGDSILCQTGGVTLAFSCGVAPRATPKRPPGPEFGDPPTGVLH
jgi:WD40 repeat protein